MKDTPRPGTIRLVSGLSLGKETSFTRQLNLLERAFVDLSCLAAVSGPPFEDLYLPAGGTLAGVPGGLTMAGERHRDPASPPDRAWILLGYPDQFPFMTTTSERTAIPTFLWTQLSRPPKSSELGFYRMVRPVALTERTWSFLAGDIQRFFSGGIPIIPHGVDTTVFQPPLGHEQRLAEVDTVKRKLGVSDSFIVGTVAANTFRKRFDRMFEAFAIFRKRLHGTGGRPPRFVVKTDRIQAHDGRNLLDLAGRYGIESEVRITEENLSDRELATLFCAFDLYVNLSEWEGFCIPVIEAMACGIPVVSHDVQGPGELLPYADLIVPGSVRNTEEGVLLLDASPEQAAKVLERAYRDEKLRKRSSEIGRKVALELYDVHRVAQGWLDLLESLR